MTTTVITNSGKTAAIAAAGSSGGIKITINGAIFGDTILTDTSVATLSSYTRDTSTGATNIPGNIIYTANSSQITYRILSSNQIQYTIYLDNTIGPFTIGNLSLLLSDGSLFSVTALTVTENKTATVSGGQAGNAKYYQIIVDINNVNSVVNVSVISPVTLSIPKVLNETLLPNPTTSASNLYLIDNYTPLNIPALASLDNNAWYYYPSYTTNTANFDSSVTVGNAVYFDTASGKFKNAEALNSNRVPVGIKDTFGNLVKIGGVYKSATAVFVTGTDYYVDPANPGKLIAKTNPLTAFAKVGKAISTTQLLLVDTTSTNAITTSISTIYSDANNGGATQKLFNTNGILDTKISQIISSNASFVFQFLSDDGTKNSNWLSVNRAGYAATDLYLTTSNSLGLTSANINATASNDINLASTKTLELSSNGNMAITASNANANLSLNAPSIYLNSKGSNFVAAVSPPNDVNSSGGVGALTALNGKLRASYGATYGGDDNSAAVLFGDYNSLLSRFLPNYFGGNPAGATGYDTLGDFTTASFTFQIPNPYGLPYIVQFFNYALLGVFYEKIIPLPIAFPNNFLNIIGSLGSHLQGNTYLLFGVEPANKNSFIVTLNVSSGSVTPYGCHFIAIGN